MTVINTINNEDKSSRLFNLRQEHRDLDDAILALIDKGVFDQLQMQRLKKKKLTLRDKISKFEDDMLPDIIA
ncbi:MAG: YdcH family protein [Sphingomonadales bacterium]